MSDMDREKIIELLQDKDFAKKVLVSETPENAQALLKEKGVDISVEELKLTRDFLLKVKNGEVSEDQLKKMADGELELEDMSQVAGGFAPLVGLGVVAIVADIVGVAGLGGLTYAFIDLFKD